MGLFRWEKIQRPGQTEATFVVGAKERKIMEAMEHRVLIDVCDQISKKVVKAIYPDVIKALDKELIVKEVSVKVSQEILDGIYGKLGGK